VDAELNEQEQERERNVLMTYDGIAASRRLIHYWSRMAEVCRASGAIAAARGFEHRIEVRKDILKQQEKLARQYEPNRFKTRSK